MKTIHVPCGDNNMLVAVDCDAVGCCDPRFPTQPVKYLGEMATNWGKGKSEIGKRELDLHQVG